MEDTTAEQVILKGVNSLELLPVNIPKITQLARGEFYARLIAILKNKDVESNDLVTNIPTLDAIVKEHFAGPGLVNFEDVAEGNPLELTKLTLLLMYITILADGTLRNKLISSPVMDQSAQVKFKYLIESIQRRGSGMSARFLDILCTEKLDGKMSGRCQTPVSNSNPWASPNVYSSSPKAAHKSPLRDLVQSPPFRMQKLLNAKTKEVKQLQQQLHRLENEKQDTDVNMVLLQKRVTKLSDELQKCQADIKEQKQYRDELEAQLMAGEDLVQQQMHRLAKESSLLRTENSSMQETLNKLLESNDVLTTKNDSLHKRHMLVTAERDRLEEEISTLSRARLENQNIIESQSCLLQELRGQLEELQQCLMENHRPVNRTIEESFEVGSPVNYYDTASPANASGSGGNVSGENMADAIVDKILAETQEQLTKLQAQHATLQERLSETTYSRDQLLCQVEALTMENDSINLELGEVKENYSQLTTQHSELQEHNKVTCEHLEELQTKYNQGETQIIALQHEFQESQTNIQTLNEQLNQQMQTITERCNQLQDAEGKLNQVNHELRLTSESLKEMSDAKCALQEEYSRTVSRLTEDFQVQKVNLTDQYEKKVEELNNNLTLIMTECETLSQEKSMLKHEIRNKEESHTSDKQTHEKKVSEMEEKLSLLTSGLEAKEHEVTEQLANFTKQMNDINAEKLLYEEKVAEVCKQINEMEAQHTVTLNNLKTEAEKQQQEFDNTLADLQNKMKELHSEKMQVSNEKDEQVAAVKCLVQEVETKQERLAKLEQEKQEMHDGFENEKTMMSSIIKAQEEALDSLKQQIEGTLQEHTNAKTHLEQAIQEKESALTAMNEKLENSMATYNTEKAKFEEDLANKDKTISDQQKQLEEIVLRVNEEKTSLLEEMQQKEAAFTVAKQEMEATATTLVAEMKMEIQKREEALKESLKKAEEEHHLQMQSLQNNLKEASVAHEKQQEINKGLEVDINTLKEEFTLKESQYRENLTDKEKQVMLEISRLTDSLKEKHCSLEKLGEEHKLLQDTHSQLGKRLVETEESRDARIAELQSQFEGKSNEMLMVKQELDQIQEEKNALVQNVQIKNEAYSNLKQEMDLAMETLKKEMAMKISEKEEALTILTEEKSNLLEELSKEKDSMNQLASEKEEALSSLMTMKQDFEQIQEEKKALLEDSHKKDETYSALKQEMDQAAETLKQEMEQMVRDREEALTTLSAEKASLLEELSTEKAAVNQMTSEKEEALSSLLTVKQELNQLQEQKEALLQNTEMKENDYIALKQQMDQEVETLKQEMEKKISEKEELMTALNKEKTNLMDMLSQEKASLNQITCEKEEALFSLSAIKEELGQIQEEKRALLENTEMKENDYFALKQQMTEKEEMLKQEMEKKILEKEEMLTALNKEKANLIEELSTEKASLNQMTCEREEALSSLLTIKQELNQAHEEKKTLLDDSHKKDEAYSALKQEIDEIQGEKAALLQSTSTKDEAYSSLKQEMDQVVDALKQEMEQKLNEKEEFLTTLQAEKANLMEELTNEKASVSQINSEKEEALSSLLTVRQELNQIHEEKKTLLENTQAKENDYSALIQQMNEQVETLKEEMEKKILEKEENLATLQAEKASLVEELSKEKVNVNQMTSKQEEVLSSLQQEKQGLVEKQEQLTMQVQHLEEGLLEKNKTLEVLHAQIQEAEQRHQLEISSVQERLSESQKEIESLKSEKSAVTEKFESMKAALDTLTKKMDDQEEHYKEQISSLNEKLSLKNVMYKTAQQELEEAKSNFADMKSRLEEEITELKESETLNKVELKNQSEENSKRMLVMKQELELLQASSEEEKKNQMEERRNMEKAAIAEFEKKVKHLEDEKMQMAKEKEEFELKMMTRIASLESDVKAKGESLSDQIQKMEEAQEQAEKSKNHALALEAKLIDKEQEVTATKEEIMRIERESERSTRSLTEELQAIKDKTRAETQGIVKKMKESYKVEVEKLLVQIEEHEKVMKEQQIMHHKYDQAKKKLSDMMTALNESKLSEEHHEKQLAKYKDHVSKLSESLQNEKRKHVDLVQRIKDLEEQKQPLKEKLQESELTIKRLGNENRTLEAQVKLADSKMRTMQKQADGHRFEIPTTSLSRAAMSESRLSDVKAVRPSVSSLDDDDVNDSQQLLLPTSPKGMKKRAVSSDMVFRKPTRQNSTLERQPRSSVDIANLAASAHGGKKKNIEKAMSDKSLGHSVPRDMLFNCEDEEELFSNKYLIDMQVGRCNPLDDPHWKRLSELQRRNSLYPPHMRSAYPAEMQFRPLQDFDDDKLRAGHAVDDRQLLNLTQATENLGLDSPAFNLRKRKSLSDSTTSETSLDSSGGKRSKRLSTSYSRPGPPTPGRKSLSRADKENRLENTSPVSVGSRGSKASPKSTYSEGASPVTTRHRRRGPGRPSHSPGASSSFSGRTPGTRSNHSGRSPTVSVLSKKGATPRGKKGMTPSSIRKILAKGKSPWRKLESEAETPRGLGDSTGSNSSSKLRIFRRPFGSRNYNVLSASLRSQENPHDLNDSLTVSTGRSSNIVDRKTRSRK